MNIQDDGFFLGSKKYGESSSILYILSRNNGLIKGFTRFTKKEPNNYAALDKISFEWSSKSIENLGFLKINLSEFTKQNKSSFLFELIKSSVSELCLKCLPFWQKNIEIFNDVETLIYPKKIIEAEMLVRYVWWEVLFLKNLGYGLNLDTCAVTGSTENIYFISPKSGNSVCFEIGKQYEKKLFRIPECFKNINNKINYKDCIQGLKITGFFLKKNFEKKHLNFIFRKELLKKVTKI